jgi:hypothetical protein
MQGSAAAMQNDVRPCTIRNLGSKHRDLLARRNVIGKKRKQTQAIYQ